MRVLYALVSSSVVAITAAGASAGILALPKGNARDAVERFVIAPGEVVMEKLDETSFKKLRKTAEKKIESGREKVEEATEKVNDVTGGRAEEALETLPHLYNIGIWAIVGFAVCLLGTIVFGVSSLKSAISLGVKATFFMVFLQGALVFGGILAWQKLKG